MDSDFNRQMHLIDERYHMENALLDAIAAGDYKRATQTLLPVSYTHLVARSKEVF